jgi:hypothetical protein
LTSHQAWRKIEGARPGCEVDGAARQDAEDAGSGLVMDSRMQPASRSRARSRCMQHAPARSRVPATCPPPPIRPVRIASRSSHLQFSLLSLWCSFVCKPMLFLLFFSNLQRVMPSFEYAVCFTWRWRFRMFFFSANYFLWDLQIIFRKFKFSHKTVLCM